jgi:hypothetical protein
VATPKGPESLRATADVGRKGPRSNAKLAMAMAVLAEHTEDSPLTQRERVRPAWPTVGTPRQLIQRPTTTLRAKREKKVAAGLARVGMTRVAKQAPAHLGRCPLGEEPREWRAREWISEQVFWNNSGLRRKTDGKKEKLVESGSMFPLPQIQATGKSL